MLFADFALKDVKIKCSFYSRLIANSQQSWESVKILIQTIDREYGKFSNNQRKDHIHSLQSTRQQEMETLGINDTSVNTFSPTFIAL